MAKIQFKRGTSATFHVLNPVLLKGEPALETDTNKIKFGDGVTAWRDLPYANPNIEIVDGGALVAPPVPGNPESFSPPDIEGLKLWMDANQTGYIHSSNGKVSMWEDISQARSKFVQSLKTNRPSVSNQIQDQNVVTFDGVNDAMIANIELPENFTLVMAFMRRGLSPNGRVLTAETLEGDEEFILCGTEFGSSFGVGFDSEYEATQAVDDLVPVIYTLYCDSSGCTTRLNGLDQKNTSVRPEAVLSRLAIGSSRYDFSEGNFSGDVAEIVMYEGVVSPADLNDVENYMMERWGIVQVSHPLLTGMKAFWPLNEESGNRIDITDAEVPLTPTGTVGFEAGVIGNAANFTGGANYLTAPTSFTLAGAFSVSVWFKPAAVTGSAPQIIQNWAGGMQGQMVLGFGDEFMGEPGEVWAYIRTADDNYRVGAPLAEANRWYHVVLVFNQTGNRLLLYVDGVLADQAVTAGNLMSTSIPLRVGVGEQTTAPNTVAFLVDQLGIWDRVLSAADVEMLYNDELGKEDFTADLYGDNVSLLLHMDKPANAVGGAGGGSGTLTNGLLAFWPLNETSGQRLDISGNARHLSDSAGASLAIGTGGATGSVAGKIGNAAEFTGDAGAKVLRLGTPLPAYETPTGSVAAWVKLNSLSEGRVIAGDYYRTPLSLWFEPLDGEFSGKLSGNQISISHPATSGAWYHLVFTYDHATKTGEFFVNGTSVGTQTYSDTYAPVVNAGGFAVGSTGDGYQNHFINGLVEAVGVWDRVLTETEVLELYNNGAGTETLAGNTDPNFNDVTLLLNLNGPGITDSSPKAHQITNNGATISTDQSKFGGASAYFDGADSFTTPDPELGTGNFTLELWFKADGDGGPQYATLFANYPQDANSGFGLYFNNNGAGAGGIGLYSWLPICNSTNAFNDTEWHHVAVTRNGNNFSLYVDGVLEGTGTSTRNLSSPSAMFGNSPEIGDRNFTGWIDDIRITKNVVRYTANFDPPTAEFPLGPIKTVTMPTVETALLLHMDGASFVDSGENRLIFTANNTAAISTLQSKFGGSSLILDGTYGFLSAPHNNKLTFDGDFTVELFAYFNDTPTEPTDIFSFCGVWDQSPNYSWLFACVPEGLRLYRSENGQTEATETVAWTPSVGEWYHIAVCQSDQKPTLPWSAGKVYQGGDIVFHAGQYWRAWFSNSLPPPGFDEWQQLSGDFSSTAKLRFFVNGAQIGSDITIPAVYKQSSAPLTIGAAGFDGHHFPGYIDEVRVTKGAALYATNFTPPTAPFADPQPTPDLLITFDDGIEDLSANAHTITNNNVSTGLPTALSAGFGNAGVFNGTNSYLVIPDAPEFDLSSGPFCIELRFIVTAPGQDINTDAKILISKDQYGVSYSWGISVAAEAIRVATANIAGDWEFLVSQIISSNEWHHIALTGDGTTMKLFYDGVLVGTKNRTLTNAAADVTIGCGSFNNPAGHFPGYIDNVRIVKGDQVYTANFAPPIASLTLPVSTPAPDLLLHFDGANGSTTFTDHGKNQLTVTATGGAVISNTQSRFGGAAGYFDGVAAHVSIEDAGKLDFTAADDFCIEGWIYFNDVTDGVPLISKGTNTSSGGWTVYVYQNTFYFGRPYIDNIINTTTTLTANTWYHVAVTRENGTLRFFLNGVQEASGENSAPFSASGWPVLIGKSHSNSYLDGYIDELRVVKGHAIYTANFTPPVAPFQNPIITITQPATGLGNGLEAFWKFDDLTDSTGNGHDLVDVGDTTITPGKIGGALTFNANTGLQYAKISNFKILRPAGFSVSGWIKSADPAQSSPPFAISHGTPFGFCVGSMMTLEYNAFQAGNNPCTGPSSTAIQILNPSGPQAGLDGNWHHLVGTFDGSVGKFYVDGVLIGEQTGVTMDDTWPVPDTYFGSGLAEYARTGQTDSVAYWTRALTESEVLALYNNGNGTETLTGGGGGGAGPITTFIDSSKHNHALTAVGNAYLNLEDIKYGSGSGEFAGGHCTIPMSPEFAFGTGDFTVEFWGNLTYAADSAVFSIAPESEETGTYLIGFRNDPNLFGFCYDIPNFTFVSADISAYYGEWAHYAFVRLDGVLKMYVNGTQVGTANTTIDLDGGTQTTAVIGRRWVDVDDHYLAGLIDDLRITKGAARYIANFNPPTKAFPDPVLVAPPAPTGDIYAENVTLLLHMDGANGSTTFTDNSYLQNTVTAEGAVISTAQSKFGGASGYFNGNDSFLSLPPSALNFGAQDFTVECWVYWSFVPNYANSLLNFNAPGGFSFYWDGGTYAVNKLVVSNRIANQFSETFLPNADEWYHLAVSRQNGTLRVFVNGVQLGQDVSAPENYADENLQIGGSTDGANWSLNGYIDDFRITKGVARYTADFIPPTEAFPNPFVPGVDATLLMHFDGADTSQNLVDSSANEFVVTSGGAAISTDQSKFGGASGDFSTGGATITTSDLGFPDDFTIEGWFFFNTNNVGYQPLMSAYAGGDATGWALTLETNNALHFYGSTGSGWPLICSSTYVPTPGQWVHVAVTRSGQTVRLFADGVQVGTTTSSINVSGGTTVGVGYYQYFPDFPRALNGYIDELRIVKGTAVYNSNFTPPTAPFSPTAAVTPVDITGCDLWLDSTGDIAESNGAILTWADKSGNGRTATPADYAPAPIVAAGDGPNGQDVVRFSGDPNVLDVSYQFNLKNSSGFVLVKHSDTMSSSSYGRFLGFQPTNGFDYDQPDGLAFSTNQGNPTGIGLYNNNIGATHAVTLPLPWTLLAYTIDANGLAKLRIDGEEVDSATFTGIAAKAGGNLYIGHGGTLMLPEALQGDIAEISLFDHALGEAALIGLERGIMQRWFPAPTPPIIGGSASLLMKFNGNFNDSSANNVSVTNTNNSVTIDTVTTKFGSGSAYFNGAAVATLTTPDLPAFGFGTGDFTIEMFVKQEVGTRNSVLSIGTYENGILWRLTPYITDSLYVGISLPNGGYWDWDATASVPFDTWTHIALTRQDGTLRAFIDGVMVLEQAGVTVDLGESRPLTIGCGAHELQPIDAYHGYIDELRIIKGTAVYTGNFTPPTQPFPSWGDVIGSSYGANIVAAYDFTELNTTTNVVPAIIGPEMLAFGLTRDAYGAVFAADGFSGTYAESTIPVNYPHTIVMVARLDIATISECNLMAVWESASFASPPVVSLFSRTGNGGILPYNGQDGQQVNFMPNSAEFAFIAASFLNDGTVRVAVRSQSGDVDIVLSAPNGQANFNGYPSVGPWFGDLTRGYSPVGTYRLTMYINQGFATVSAMNALFADIAAGPASDITF